MADELIVRKDLIQRINKVTRDDFIKAAQESGFVVTKNATGSHCAIRRPAIPVEDFRSFIYTVYEDMSKQTKVKVFKALRREGVDEDELWRHLGLREGTPIIAELEFYLGDEMRKILRNGRP